MQQWRVFAVTLVVVGLIGILGIAFPSVLGGKSIAARPVAPPVGADVAAAATPTASPSPTSGAAAPSATATRPSGTSTPEPRATLPPVFTPTSVPRGGAASPAPANGPANSGNSGSGGSSAGSGSSSAPPPAPVQRAASAPPRPTNTPVPTFTRTSTPTATSTATATPAYDFIVTNITEIPHPENRDLAYIRGRLIDQDGNLVSGAYFQIRSDSASPWVAVEPHGTTTADGTAVFAVSRGRFAVRVLGGRSEEAGWMVTGTGTDGPMSDFEFTFQTTGPLRSGLLVSPTPTDTPVILTSTPTATASAPTKVPSTPTQPKAVPAEGDAPSGLSKSNATAVSQSARPPTGTPTGTPTPAGRGSG